MRNQILDRRAFRMDDILRRPYTNTTPFGSSGNCLWAKSPQGWGFVHGVHWIHKTVDDGLAPYGLTITANGEPVLPGDSLYRPSHITLNGKDDDSGLQITEDKFITQDDVVVSVLSLRNGGDHALDFVVRPTYGVPQGENILQADQHYAGLPVWVRRSVPTADDLRQTLPPGGRCVLRFAVAFAQSEEQAQVRATRWAKDESAVLSQGAQYQQWFDDNIPLFDCSDPWLTKMWYHRWYIVKKNHSRPQIGQTLEDTFSEGRWNHRWYSASITYGAGHVLREVRWLRDKRYFQNYFRGFARNQREDGLYRSWYVNGIARPDGDEGKFTDWIVAALYDAHCVHPDERFLREALPSLVKNVEYWQTHDWDGDGLLVVDDHWQTGMEWSPSFFAKNNFDVGVVSGDGRDVQNPVKRVDLTTYHLANLQALFQIAQRLGESEIETKFLSLLDAADESFFAIFWDEESTFFFDVLPKTNEKLFSCKNITGFYPAYARMVLHDHSLRLWQHLVNPAEFWTKFPPASAAQDIPAFSQESKMLDKPLTECWWNGPTWPHSISIVAMGMGWALKTVARDRKPNSEMRRVLFEMIQSFGRAQFENNDFDLPLTGEFYRGDNGAWQTEERDYHHSTWADLILSCLVGIETIDHDHLSMLPLLPTSDEGGWSHFCVQDLPFRGRLLTIVWDDPLAPGDAYDDGDKGLTIYCDGEQLHHQHDLAPLSVTLPPPLGEEN